MNDRNVSNLRIGLGVDPREMKAGLARAQRHLKSFAGFAKNMGILSAAAFGGAAIGLSVMAKAGLANVDAQAKMARSLDGSIDGLRALQIAGEDAGVSAEAVGAAMQKMGARLSEAAREGKGPAHEMLQTLGLDAEKMLELDIDERLGLIADRAKSLGFSAAQTSDALKEFGITNKEMSLLVVQGGDAIRAARQEVADYGMSVDAVSAGAVERANDAMSRMSMVMEGFRTQLAVAVAPALEAAALQFRELAASGGPLQVAAGEIAEAFGELLETLADPAFVEAATTFGVTILQAVSGLADVITFLADNAEIAGAAMVALGGAMLFFSGPIGLAIAAVAGGLFLLSSAFGDAETSASDADLASAELAKTLAIFTNTSAPLAGKAAIDLANNNRILAQSAYEAAEAELAKITSMNAAAEARLKEGGGVMPFATAAGLDLENEAAAALSARADELRRAKAELENAFKVVSGGLVDPSGVLAAPGPIVVEVETPDPDILAGQLDALLARMDPAIAKTKQYDAALATLNASLNAGIITQAEYNAHIATLDASLKSVPTAAAAAVVGVQALRKGTLDVAEESNAVKDSFKSLFVAIGDGSQTAGQALAGLLDKLNDLLLNSMADSLLGSDFVTGIFDSIGLSKNANGNAFANGRITAFASGGVVNGPTFFPMNGPKTGLMGEAGPEAIMPLTRIGGKLGVRAAPGGGGGNSSVSIHVDVTGARGNAEIQEMVSSGVSAGLRQYDSQVLPKRVNQISTDPRGIG
ncbi:hypothetical protein [Falsihalocynthiibacter sp. CO-5D18]|uniref:hypothetical protein n=1 Tax=Falsihalocynthiibacter sp. CO-5D18 TaxID=3240872 RepID=UPI00350EDFB7